jgi:competence protein ComEC
LLTAAAGDRLRIFCRIRRLAAPANPGERDLRAFHRADRKLCQLHAAFPDCVQVLDHAADNGWIPRLRRLRGHFSQMLDQHLNDDNRDLADAILLGIRESVPREQIDAFFLTGTTHLLAISGFNVAILASGFFFAARRGILPFRTSLIGVMALTIGYALLTESQPPVLRAAILIQVLCVSWLARRKPHPFNALTLAALIVLIINPADLFRVGPQLSFIAVAVLGWISTRPGEQESKLDPLDQLIWRSRPWFVRARHTVGQSIWGMIFASLLVWLLTLPLTMCEFHLLSPVAIVLNLVLFVPMAAILYGGAAVLVLGWLIPPLAAIPGAICNVSLNLLRSIVESAQGWPASHFWVAGPGPLWTFVFYVGVFYCAVATRWRPNRKWSWALAIGWWTLPMMFHAARAIWEAPHLQCTFVSVGHGTSVLIRLPRGETVLYDCGHLGTPKPGVEAIAAVLWSNGVTHLDAVVLSHADADHYNALPGLLERFSVGAVYIGHAMFAPKTDALRFLRQSIEQADVAIRGVSNQHQFRIRDATMRILHPPDGARFGADNDASIVLFIEYAGFRMLLPGDLEGVGVELLTIQPALDTDLVMAPHHGSLTVDPRDFLDWSTPEASVISGRWEHGAGAAIEYYRQWSKSAFHTGRDGAVLVEIRSDELTIASFRERRTAKFAKPE